MKLLKLVAEWYRLTPVQRLPSEGSLDPEPDTQGPFFDGRAARASGPPKRSMLEPSQSVWFDDIVVARQYLGPIVRKHQSN